MRRIVIALLVALFLAGVGAGSASARDLFKSDVAGIQVAGQVIAGIPGGAPWDTEGEVEISFQKRSGLATLELEVEGLVLVTPIIPADPVFPVLGVCASLVCQKTAAGDPTNEQVATTGNFPLSPVTGDAEIEEVITLPAVCVAPIVLVRVSTVDANFFGEDCAQGTGTCTSTGVPFPIGCNGPWIAASGF